MDPLVLGAKYDKIAQWWHDRHVESSYGVSQFARALAFAPDGGMALDVGCGSGGRFVRSLERQGFTVTGLDVSQAMVALASKNHPDHEFIQQDICTWESANKYDFIVAWDSIFHLPFDMQSPVLAKLCGLLASNGVLIYSFGNAIGEHTDQWHDDTFYYSSIGMVNNVQLLLDNGLTLVHLELDQYPLTHVYAIAINK